ncbi:hypothetical protein U4960_04195 [Altererythrobacter sp. H2]|uniref:hypothetical protein n=1 Tax=Altererythrobacter sp. H2 TaxID=3108391 RepID=UPI002B4BBA9E|nr:hypothetical protein [Altererythrobacter sp. H2]WRK96533.1 hypothetical protein U4960_04195 [Altererythrobacter sp. H2]
MSPALLHGNRRALAAALAVLALTEAALMVLFAQSLDRIVSSGDWLSGPAMPVAIGIALLAGLALVAQRWVGELFAQSFVTDCRAALFQAVTRHAGEGGDARWLTGLVNDMAALRNYALRGSVRFWTSALSGTAASLWILASLPQARPALLALASGLAGIALMARALSRTIRHQRRERGKLNGFLVRRVRAELAGAVSAKGHGFRKLAALSGQLGSRSVQRATIAGAMETAATVAGLAAALIVVWQSIGLADGAAIAGPLTLIAFVAARLLEWTRALHARLGGAIALERLARLLSIPPQRGAAANRNSRRSLSDV